MFQSSSPLPQAQDAVYHDPVVPAYRGNPLIEALPPLLERAEAQELMRYLPEYDDSMRSHPAIQREHHAAMVAAIRIPTWLHGELYSRISRLMCNGYVSRNPALPGFQAQVAARQELLAVGGLAGTGVTPALRMNGSYRLRPNIMPDSNGLTFLGTSGIGKSSAIGMALGLWPQLILHREYGGQTFSRVQITWLKLDVPSDGSVLSLAERFFIALDQIYAAAGLKSDFLGAFVKARATETKVAPSMARVAQQVGLGVLVLDELQDLTPGKSRKFLSFLVQLVNIVGVPVILVGGLDAFHLVTEQFRQVRRGSTEGDLIVTQSQPGERWKNFCRVIWLYQFTEEWVEMTDAHAAALFEVSQGITDLLVIAFKNAQIRAISTGAKKVTPAIIRSVRDTLNQAQLALGAMRRGSDFVMDRMSDLKVPKGVETQPFLRGDDVTPDSKPTKAAQPAARAETTEPEPAGAEEAAEKLTSDEAPCPTPQFIGSKSTGAEGENALLSKVLAGQKDGLTPTKSLKRSGFGDGPLWRRVASLPG